MSDKIEFELDDTDPSLDLVQAEPEIEGVEPPSTPVAAEPAAAPAPADAEPVDGIAELKAKLEAEKEAAEARARAAEERAAKSEREASDGRAETLDGRINQLSSAVAQLNSNAEILKREFRDAYQSGDFDKLADIQFKMGEVAAQRMEIERAKQHFEQIKRAPAPKPAPSPAPANNGWEQQNPRSAAWLKANPQVAADDVGRAELAMVHAKAVKAGHPVDSEGYIAFFDKHYTPETSAASPAAAPARKAPPVAAPPSRQAAPAATAKTVKLTAFDREIAEASGVSYEDYARAKLATQKS